MRRARRRPRPGPDSSRARPDRRAVGLKPGGAAPITASAPPAFSGGATLMKAASSTVTPEIDVQALRVGMFVHLDVGWMSHPFPLSSFRIASAAQLATIRSLGAAR